MQNREQIRARNALLCANSNANFRGDDDGGVVKKISPLVMNHGLLATAAFACSQKRGSGWQTIFDHIARHLADPDIQVIPKDKVTLRDLLNHLSGPGVSSETLKMATSETMAWLQYARRFIDCGGKS